MDAGQHIAGQHLLGNDKAFALQLRSLFMP